MHRLIPRRPAAQLMFAFAIVFAVSPATATVLHYRSVLSGPNESPPNTSTGIGNVELTIDDVANTMRVQATFSGLQGTTTACHIHAPTTNPQTGTAGVATTTPFFAGFPIGVTSGSYDNTLDLTQSSSYNASYITANGGTTAGAESALLAALAASKAYFNIHTTSVPGGEIRGFPLPFDPTPTSMTTWSRVKSLYH